MKNYVFTSESVSEGHPDKICDQLSDAILDAYLTKDPHSRVAVEAVATTNRIILLGEVNSQSELTSHDLEIIARKVVRDIGYEQEDFHWKNFIFQNFIHQQSQDIAQGIGEHGEGAGDQGIMFGYACNENDYFMPTPILCAHKIVKTLADARKKNMVKGLGPDAKSQVSVHYQDGVPTHIDAIVVSTQHHPSLSQSDIYNLIVPLIRENLPKNSLNERTRFIINPSGRFVIGGPVGDAGLTGRKIIVDTYGGAAPHGGGAFSGKDPTKVDRSAAYMARYLAKNVVASGLASVCTIQLSYAIGLVEPTSLYVNTNGTGKIPDEQIAIILEEIVDLSPRAIRRTLGLDKPIYQPTACYGHFGRQPDESGHFSWENLDLVENINATISKAA